VGLDGQPSFVTYGLAESAELSKLNQNAKLHGIPSVSREFLFSRFAFSIFPLIQGFLQRNVEREVPVPAPDSTLISKTGSAEECRGWTPQSARSRSASPKKRTRVTTEAYDELRDASLRWKRARLIGAMSEFELDTDNRVIAAGEPVFSADSCPPSTWASASQASNLSQNTVHVSAETQNPTVADTENVYGNLDALRKRFLEAERQKSDPGVAGLRSKSGREVPILKVPKLQRCYAKTPCLWIWY
jgi:hypothetical protein